MDVTQFCSDKDFMAIVRVVGYVVFAIKIVVPIILIIVGMIDLAKAVSAKDEGEIKKAQQALVKKAIAAVLVFLVVTIVSILMGLVSKKEYKDCMVCINRPFSSDCKEKANALEGEESSGGSSKNNSNNEKRTYQQRKMDEYIMTD